MKDIEDKLLSAIADNNQEQVSFLLQAGANPNYIACFDETPLIYACRHNDIKPAIVKNLLAYGANPNHLESNGFSPLLLAIMRQNLEVIDILINAGADITATLQGKNIIWYSLQSSNKHMLGFILKRTGIDINTIDSRTGYNSLDWSIFHQMPSYINSLKAFGACTQAILQKQ